MNINKFSKILSELTPDQMQDIADTLVWIDESKANRFRSAIAIAQQEWDYRNNQELQKQYEFMQNADSAADRDASYYRNA